MVEINVRAPLQLPTLDTTVPKVPKHKPAQQENFNYFDLKYQSIPFAKTELVVQVSKELNRYGLKPKEAEHLVHSSIFPKKVSTVSYLKGIIFNSDLYVSAGVVSLLAGSSGLITGALHIGCALLSIYNKVREKQGYNYNYTVNRLTESPNDSSRATRLLKNVLTSPGGYRILEAVASTVNCAESIYKAGMIYHKNGKLTADCLQYIGISGSLAIFVFGSAEIARQYNLGRLKEEFEAFKIGKKASEIWSKVSKKIGILKYPACSWAIGDTLYCGSIFLLTESGKFSTNSILGAYCLVAAGIGIVTRASYLNSKNKKQKLGGAELMIYSTIHNVGIATLCLLSGLGIPATTAYSLFAIGNLIESVREIRETRKPKIKKDTRIKRKRKR